MDEENKQYKEKMKNSAEKFSEAAKDKAKKEIIKKIIAVIGIKGIAIIVLIVIVASLLATVFLAAAVHFNDLDRKSKATSAKTAAIGNEALGKIIEMEDNKYKIKYTKETGEEVTGKDAIKAILEDNDMNFEDFNDEEIECLYKCLKAEWATTYPNLGERVDNQDIDSEYVQGAIEIKKGKSNGEIISLNYISYNDFQTKVNNNDQSVLNEFSLKDGNLVVANSRYNKVECTITGDAEVPADMILENSEETIITEKIIDYKSMLGIHKMSFEFLLSLLVNTEKVDFVSEIADLAFNNIIMITLYENEIETVSTQKETYEENITYEKNMYYNKYIKWTFEGGLSQEYGPIGATKSETRENYNNTKSEITTTITNVEHSYVLAMSGESWLASINNEYNYNPNPDGEETISGPEELYEYGHELEPQTINNVEDDPDVINFQNENYSINTDTGDDGTTLITESYCRVSYIHQTGNRSIKSQVTETKVNINKKEYTNTNNTTDEVGTDFKNVYDKHPGAQAQFDNVSSWLFELLEETESTVDYVSVMKYLLFVCTGEDYGVTELSQDMLENGAVTVNNTAGGVIGFRNRFLVANRK